MSSETARFFKLFGAPALHAGRGKILPQLAAEFLRKEFRYQSDRLILPSNESELH